MSKASKTGKSPQNRRRNGSEKAGIGGNIPPAEHRFQPGQSGNPGGRPKKTPYTDAHAEVAEMMIPDLNFKDGDSVAMGMAKVVAREALRGKIQAAAEAANRVEGTPRQRHEITGIDGGVIFIISSMERPGWEAKLREANAKVITQ